MRTPRLIASSLSRVLVLALLGSVGGWGCGRRGPPTPPELRLPEPPRDPTLSAPGGVLTLSWSPPREDMGGRPLSSVSGYRIDRAEWPPGEGACETCPERFETVAELDNLMRRSRGLPPTSWEDPRIVAGWIYRYRVRALDGRGRAGPPARPVTIAWQPLPELHAEVVPGDQELRIRWEAGKLPPGLEPRGIHIYDERGRRIDRGDGEPVVTGLPNGIPVVMEVRLAARTPEGWVVEGPGLKLRGTPLDTVPPVPPEDVVAISEPVGIRLRWLPAGTEPYDAVLILRATEEAEPSEIARLPGQALEFLDRDVTAGETYQYAVVALDRSGNRSLPSPEVRVRFR